MNAPASIVLYATSTEAKVFKRDQIRSWAADLGFEHGVMLRDSPGARFRALAAASRLQYKAGDQFWTIRAEQVAKTSNYETFVATTKRGKVAIKIAEVKLFPMRRTAKGQVRGTHRLKVRVRDGLEGAHAEAANKWVKTFESTYNDVSQNASGAAVREIIRRELKRHCYHATYKKSMGVYFIYTNDIEQLEPLREFIRRLGPPYSLTVLPVECTGEEAQQFFVEAAEDATLSMIDESSELLQRWTKQSPNSRMPTGDMVRTYDAEVNDLQAVLNRHEEKLGCILPRSRGALDDLRNIVDTLR